MKLCPILDLGSQGFSFIRKIVLYKNCGMIFFSVAFAAKDELIEVAE
jgi:hypothetical protein